MQQKAASALENLFFKIQVPLHYWAQQEEPQPQAMMDLNSSSLLDCDISYVALWDS